MGKSATAVATHVLLEGDVDGSHVGVVLLTLLKLIEQLVGRQNGTWKSSKGTPWTVGDLHVKGGGYGLEG